ncbi:MAG: hypothetical protein JO256_05440 [Alphaproteobacteria bacterium]|nr:hypothetical protein [Alphaproteobacteria bacterium]
MWYPPVVTVAPTSEPVTLATAKTWGRLDGTDDDVRITTALTAARAHVESLTGVLLAQQTVAIKCDAFCDFEAVPLAPLRSITSITYTDSAGNTQTLSTSVYEVRAEGFVAAIVLKYGQAWPAIQPGSRITVTAACGYADADLPPASLAAVQLLTVAMVDTGGFDQPTLDCVAALLANQRRFM